MILGIGVDILRISRIAPSLHEHDSFFLRVFTEDERLLIRESDNPVRRAAMFFAAKEAVFKALGCEAEHFRLNTVEVGFTSFGEPEIHLLESTASLAEGKGVGSVRLSLSSEDEYVVAFVATEQIRTDRKEEE